MRKKREEMAKIDKDMTFNEVLRRYPDSIKVFRRYNMHCFGCLGADAETIEYGAMAHGVDVQRLLEELNETVGK